jgi:hypothetical protein
MKINKILAAGTAATLAVTSLAAVASAKTRSYPLTYSFATITANPFITGTGAEQLDWHNFGQNAVYNRAQITKGAIGEAYALETLGNPTTDRATNDPTYDGAGNTIVRANTFLDTKLDSKDMDAIIPIGITTNCAVVDEWGNNVFLGKAGNVKVVVTGTRKDQENYINITRQTSLMDAPNAMLGYSAKTTINSNGSALNLDPTLAAYAYDDIMYTDIGTDTSRLYVLPLYYGTAPINGLLPSEFDSVATIEIDASGAGNYVFETTNEDLYTTEAAIIAKYWGYDFLETNRVAYTDLDGTAYAIGKMVVCDYDDTFLVGDDIFVDINSLPLFDAAQGAYLSAIQLTEDTETYDWNKSASVAAISFTGEYFPIYDITTADIPNGDGILNPVPTPAQLCVEGNDLVEEIAKLLDITIKWRVESAVMGEANAWLPVTDVNAPFGTITRDEVWNLSTTHDYTSEDRAARWFDGATQTYTVEDYRKGTQPHGFAGLASQMADFFNLCLNGKVTFTFVDVTSTAGSGWLNGGIPSTEVGLRNVLSGANPDDFALYINYNTTTGSLETVVDIDVDAGEVTFDISKNLEALGGYTIGTVHDIYYAMTKGTTKLSDGTWGMVVSKVTLTSEEESDVAAAGDDDDDDVVVVEDDDDDVVVVEDDDDDVVVVEDDDDIIIEDDDDDVVVIDEPEPIEDDDIGGEVIVVTGDDDDANPHTGVALAVVPAIVAAAAIVVSKKRK